MANVSNFGTIYCYSYWGDPDDNLKTLAPRFCPDCIDTIIGLGLSNAGEGYLNSITIDTNKILLSQSTTVSHL